MGSGFAHGRLNPETGLNTRLEDFTAALSRCVDCAISKSVDLVLFGGDAFPDATPPPLVQQAFAGQFRRLADAGIPTVLLVGNHDQHAQGQGGASLCIYRTLGVPGMVVGDRLATHRLETGGGPVQIVTLPWLTRSALLTRPETEGMSVAEVNQTLVDRLRIALEGEVRQLNPDLPTVLLAHVMTDTATYGAERFLAAGRGFSVPMPLLARPCFDYVALGHVHRHQVLCESPLTLYPGSIERVDFSEEEEEKGFVLVELVKGHARAEFCPLPVRPFRTLRVDVSDSDNPEADLLAAIAAKPLENAVVRLLYQLRPEQLEQVNVRCLEEALSSAHTYTIQPELVSQLARARVPELGTDSALEPMDALQRYLSTREDLGDIAEALVEAAQGLMREPEGDYGIKSSPESLPEPDDSQQLRLL